MAMNESQVVATELEHVESKIATLFDEDDKFFTHIKKRNVVKISNRQMRVPLKLRTGGSFLYFGPDGQDLGRGGGPTWDKAVLTSVFMAEAIEYTKLAEWATDDSRKAVINAVRELTAGSMREIKRQIDSQLMGTGNGVVGVISVVATSGGVDTYTFGTDGFGARLIRAGQTVQIFDTTLATNRGSTQLISVDVENKQATAPAVAGAIATDKLVVLGITTPTALPGLFGVPYHHSNSATGTWLGFSRANTPEIRASRVNASSSALTLPLPRLAINKIGNRVGIDNNFNPEAWMNPAQQAAYEEIGQLVSIIHKQAKDEALDMYFGDNMQMAGAPVKTSWNWDNTRIDFIVSDVWGRGEILPLGFYTVDGRRIFEIRGPSGGVATADIFYMTVGMQTFVNNPAACSYIDNLLVPTGY